MGISLHCIDGRDDKMDIDDKDLAMICLTVLGIATMIIRPEVADRVVLAIVSAIAGFVTGRKRGEK